MSFYEEMSLPEFFLMVGVMDKVLVLKALRRHLLASLARDAKGDGRNEIYCCFQMAGVPYHGKKKNLYVAYKMSGFEIEILKVAVFGKTPQWLKDQFQESEKAGAVMSVDEVWPEFVRGN